MLPYQEPRCELSFSIGAVLPHGSISRLWEDVVKRFGKKTLAEVLASAIDLAEEGFPLGPMTAEQWAKGHLQGEESHRVLRPGGRNPQTGDLIRNPDLAKTFRILGARGAREGFYSGEVANSIVEALREFDGVMTLDDLTSHFTAVEDPISVVYKGYRVYETPPPTQGLPVLIALSILEKTSPDPTEFKRGSELQAHYGIEAMRLAFADALQYISDPRHLHTPLTELLSQGYIASRASCIKLESSTVESGNVSEFRDGDTVYFCCIDADGNGCSMINSNYMHFGTGIMAKGYGFTIQNRGFNFSLERGHPNQLAPRKRPYHTIIPCIITNESDGSLFSVLGNMGGFMQPQGHLQLIRNLLDFKMSPQAAVDAPRWMLNGLGATQSHTDVRDSHVFLEDGYGGESDGGGAGDKGERVVQALKGRGHMIDAVLRGTDRELVGRGQIIIRDKSTHVLSAGSDPRADGCAVPVVGPIGRL